ncbi:MAG: type I-E CRISPR-associated protein Cas6/Cse3/CasE [Anaerolineaceae bacterium]|nr:type I-E CRISPR-associated protein Cas6/Cse3/CasE [Anaerolineaceae bacterium]
MYLSKLKFDPLNRQVRKEFANRYELHRTLYAQFKSYASHEIGLLYRAEEGDPYTAGPLVTLIQSQLKPDWEPLYAQGLLMEKAEIRSYEPTCKKGELFYFRLLANPTTRRNEGSFAGKRVGLLLAEEQEAWLRRKGAEGGFMPLSLETRPSEKIISKKMIAGELATLTHLSVLYNGSLEVLDEHAFEASLVRGLGSAKAFGFGLLSLARA